MLLRPTRLCDLPWTAGAARSPQPFPHLRLIGWRRGPGRRSRQRHRRAWHRLRQLDPGVPGTASANPTPACLAPPTPTRPRRAWHCLRQLDPAGVPGTAYANSTPACLAPPPPTRPRRAWHRLRQLDPGVPGTASANPTPACLAPPTTTRPRRAWHRLRQLDPGVPGTASANPTPACLAPPTTTRPRRAWHRLRQLDPGVPGTASANSTPPCLAPPAASARRTRLPRGAARGHVRPARTRHQAGRSAVRSVWPAVGTGGRQEGRPRRTLGRRPKRSTGGALRRRPEVRVTPASPQPPAQLQWPADDRPRRTRRARRGRCGAGRRGRDGRAQRLRQSSLLRRFGRRG